MNKDKFQIEVKKAYKTHKGRFNYKNLIDNHLNIERFGPWIEQVNNILPIKNKVILSSGCGSAGDLFYFSKYNPKKIYGIEVSPILANLAIKRLKLSNITNYQIDTYDGASLPYPDNSFDIIYSMHVIEHTSNYIQYLKELYRTLKPKGIIFLEVPNKHYPLEQHTGLKLIHWFPPTFKDTLYKFSKRFRALKFAQNYDRLDTNLILPNPFKLYILAKNLPESKILQSYFHSYDGKYDKLLHPFSFFRKSTFRLVLSKSIPHNTVGKFSRF